MWKWLVLLSLVTARPALADDGLDVKDWLSRPGVKLLAVEFYASWCGPCKKAVPQWKALHEMYRDHGLRLVVVSVQDPDGACVNPGWNPDDVICDAEGRLAKAWGVGDRLPAAFLWSWRGTLLVRNGHLNEVLQAAGEELGRLPRVTLDEGMEDQLRAMLRTELARTGKVAVVAGAKEEKQLTEIRRKSHDVQYSDRTACRLGQRLAANSLLKASFVNAGAGQRLLVQLFSAESGCLNGSAGVFWNTSNPEQSVAEAVAELVSNLRVSVEMPGVTQVRSQVAERTVREKSQAWDPDVAAAIVVQFETSPPGATLLVDGQPLCQATPCSKTLAPGPHKIQMAMEKHMVRSETVKLDQANRWVNWTLEPDFGWLSVQSTPSGLPVLVDGSAVGRTPLHRQEIARGPHQVLLQDSQYIDERRDINIGRGEEKSLVFELEARLGAIQVSASDEVDNDLEADVWVDGYHLGKTPITAKVIIGRHEVKVQAIGLKDWEREVSVAERETLPVRATLAAARPAPVYRAATPRKKAPRKSARVVRKSKSGKGPERLYGSSSSVDEKRKEPRKSDSAARGILDFSLAVTSISNEYASVAVSCPLHLGFIFGDLFQLAAFADLGGVSNSAAPESEEEDDVEGKLSYTGTYGLAATVWLPGRRSPFSVFAEAFGGYHHVADRCLDWESNGTTDKGGTQYSCTDRGTWSESGDDSGMGIGVSGGLKMGFGATGGDMGILLGGMAHKRSALGWSWGGFVGLTLF